MLDYDDIERLAERIDAEREAPEVVDAVRSLPDVQREAVELVAIDGLTATEAAERIGTSPTAVRMRLSRARKTVRDAIDPQPDSHDDTAEVLP